VPRFDAELGREVTVGDHGERKHRLVVIGDSLTHGFQSGAIYNTELAYGAIVAHELAWDGFRFPRYGGPGGCRSTSNTSCATSGGASAPRSIRGSCRRGCCARGR
jgi:hypothetical protein